MHHGLDAITRPMVATGGTDRDQMVVKALSWALRALQKQDPTAVRQFVREHEAALPRLVVREVTTR